MTAVMFDMDGLLLDTEGLYLRVFREICDHRGWVWEPAFYMSMVGCAAADNQAKLAAWVPDGVDATEIWQEWHDRHADALTESVPLRPGAAELVAELRARDVPMGVVTSSRGAGARRQLATAGLLDAMEFVLGGDEVPRPKPDPTPYIMGAERHGLAPQECVAFEDSENGTRAAVASGARVVQVPDIVPPSDALRALGHIIAPDLLSGARAVGLI